MKILELRSENVKRLIAVEVHPGEDPIVTITGENGAGKSSVLDSIMYALGGKDTQPPEVIRRGESHAEVVVDLGDYVVTRRWTPSGSTLSVQSKDGARYPSPQALLDKMIGSLSFDPLAFIRLPPKEQAETVRKLVGVDTKQLDADYQTAYDLRTKIRAEGVAMKARFDAMPLPPADLTDEPVSVDQLLNEQARLQEQKRANDKVRSALEQTKTLESASLRQIQSMEAELARLTAALDVEKQKVSAVTQERAALEEEVETLEDPDIAEIVRQISRSTATNMAVKARTERNALGAQLEVKRQEVLDLHAKVEKFQADKAELISKAKFPVPGMSFSGEGLTFNSLPLEQASSAEQLRVGLAMGLALNPRLRVVLIRDGSLLDSKSMKLVAEMAAEANAQVWIERVGGGGKVGFEIVEGFVVSRDGVPVERPQLTPSDASITLTVDEADKKPALSLVRPIALTEIQPDGSTKTTPIAKGPTFKKRPIAELSGEELQAAIAEVEKSINAAPLAQKSTAARAKKIELEAELNRRLDDAVGGEVQGREPGQDG